jgi:hypothetical protein
LDLSLWPTATIASSAGINSWPKGVSSYSTDGGEVGRTFLLTSPRSCSSVSLVDNTFAETGGISTRNSLKRLDPIRKHHMTLGPHAPEIRAMQSVSAHDSGGRGLLFIRSFSAMEVIKLLEGNLIL